MTAGEESLDGPRFQSSAAPRVEPLSYPGAWPSRSVLIGPDGMWEILGREGGRLTWGDDGAERLSACRVRTGAAVNRDLGITRGVHPHLGTLLQESNLAGVDNRAPVVAIGSNAAPAQLRNKFAASGVEWFIPSVRARVDGIRVGFAAFVAPRGYVPATLYPSPESSTEVFVQWLDPQQLAELDETESPYYRRVWLDAQAGVGIRLETGERLGGAYAYVAHGGTLGDADGAWIMATPDGEAPGESARWCATQSDVVSRLQRHPALAESLGADPAAFAARTVDLPDRGVGLLRDAGLVLPGNAFEDLPDAMGEPAIPYRRLLPDVPEASGEAVTAVVSPSADAITRDAQSVVRLDPDDWERLGRPESVEIASAVLLRRQGARAPRALAVVVPQIRGDAPGPARGSRRIEMDHVLRMAIGVEIGETAAIVPARVRRPKWPDLFLGRPNCLVLRVTLADPSSAERDVCLMSELSLSLLGISSGDHVVLEGAPDENGEVRAMTLKAFETPEHVAAERERISGGTWASRFPGARDTLGVSPDIPTVFLDSATRDKLGIAGRQLTTVRARPARLQQFGHEVREILLVLVIALIGIIGLLTDDQAVTSGLIGLIVAATMVLVVAGLRRRLSHTAIRHRVRRARRRPRMSR